MPLGHGSPPWAPAWSARDSTLDPVAHLDRGRGGPWPAWLRVRSAGPRGALRVFRESRRQAHAPAPPGVWVQRPGLRPQGLPGTRLMPAVPRHTASLVRVGAVRRAADTPNFGGPGFVKQGTRVPSSGSNGWELPVRRAWYGAYYGRRIKARPFRPIGPGWAAEPSCRAGGARVRRPTERAGTRLEPAGTPKVVGPESA